MYVLVLVASQCWLFSRLLPLIIGDLIPDNDAHWDTFLLLHEILALCMAPCISPASISYLEVLIEMHHRSYRSCYPAETITPKMHYIVHFPELIRRYEIFILYFDIYFIILENMSGQTKSSLMSIPHALHTYGVVNASSTRVMF